MPHSQWKVRSDVAQKKSLRDVLIHQDYNAAKAARNARPHQLIRCLPSDLNTEGFRDVASAPTLLGVPPSLWLLPPELAAFPPWC